MNRLRIMVYAPESTKGDVREVDNSRLHQVFGNILGGYLELVRTNPLAPLDIYVNEDGQRLELKPNRCAWERWGVVILGPIIVTKGDYSNGEQITLTDEDIKRTQELLDSQSN